MKKNTAFTLIELLVVIAIIALLLAILIPSLTKAKQLAAVIPCMANQRTIAMAFNMYADDNNGWMVTGHAIYDPAALTSDATMMGRTADERRRSWVLAPIAKDGTNKSSAPTVEYEKNGIMAGQLWPYMESLDSFHCPADKRASRYDIGWRSYSMVAGIGAFYPPCMDVDQDIHKITNIPSPSSKYITVEESENKWWNMGSWAINIRDQYWYDPIAGWHASGSTLGFADGHAEKKKWRDKRTREWLQGGAVKESPDIDHNSPTMNPDMVYMLKHFPHRR